MPPSGFSQEAINGLLVFVKDSYEKTLERYSSSSLSERDKLKDAGQYLDKLVQRGITARFDDTISPEGVKGLVTFLSVNFEDLINEINIGKKMEGEAMQVEINDISRYLKQFTIH